MSGVSRNHQDVDIDLVQLFRAIWLRKKTVITVSALAAGLAFAGSSLMEKQYSGQTQLLIEPRVLASENAAGDRTPPDELAVSSQVQLLKSTDLLKQVARDMKLFELDEFDSSASPLAMLASLAGLSGAAVDLPPEERTLKALREKLMVYQSEGSRVVTIDFSSSDPKLAAAVANRIAEVYLALQSGAKLNTSNETARWLEPEIASLREKVREAEKKVADYRASNELLPTSDSSTFAARQLNDISAELARLRGERAAAEARAENVRNALASGRDTSTLGDIVASPVIQRLKEQESTLQAQISDLSTSLLEAHPRLKGLRAQLVGLREQMKQETRRVLASLENEANVTRLREKQLNQQLNTLKTESARAGDNEVGLKALEREAAAQRQLLETYLARYREAASRMDPSAAPADARVISRAVEPREASFPKVIPITIVSGLAGFILAAVYILLSELFSGRALRPVEDEVEEDDVAIMVETVEKRQPAPLAAAAGLLALTPAEEVEEEKVSIPAQEPQPASKGEEFALDQAARAIAEGDYKGQPILAISPDGDEGSALTVALARHLAASGLRVLFMDLTGSGVPTLLASDRDDLPGLTDLLTGGAAFGEIIHPDQHSRAHMVPRGTADPRVALRAIERLPMVIAALTDAYERVIVECGAVAAGDLNRLLRGGKATLLFSMPDFDEDRLVEWFGAFEKAGFDDFLLVTGAPSGRRAADGLQAA